MRWIIFLILFSISVIAADPVLLFSDLTDGTVSGWENSTTRGAAVSIWCRNVGALRASSFVTVGGVNLTSDSDYAEWGATTNPTTATGQERITFWLNSNMSLGSSTISITTENGTSNEIPFYCRDNGNLYFIDDSGNDSNDGLSVENAWLTFPKARDVIDAGDTVYVKTGVYTTAEAYNAILPLYNGAYSYNSGTVNNSIAFSAYPGEFPQIGNGEDSSDGNAVYFLNPDSYQELTELNHWTFSKLKFLLYNRVLYVQQTVGVSAQTGIRWIGNDIQITHGSMGNGFALNPYGSLTDWYVMGNYFHDVGYPGDSYNVYCIYIGGNYPGKTASVSNNIEIAWNEFYHIRGRGVDVYGHVYQDSIDELKIHHNYFHDINAAAIVVGGGDPGSTYYANIVDAYIHNNIITDSGKTDGVPVVKMTEGSWGSDGGNFYFYNNVMYDNVGPAYTGDFWITGPDSLIMRNNIICSSNTFGYVTNYGGDASGSFGDHNLWYGNGDGPSWSIDDLDNVDPLFISADPQNLLDFRLQEISPAIDNGTSAVSNIVTTDFLEVARPQGNHYDIGAYEYVPRATEQYHDADTNEDGNISTSEMRTFVTRWRAGEVLLSQVVEAIEFWKA